jgi:WD40 repeat protein
MNARPPCVLATAAFLAAVAVAVAVPVPLSAGEPALPEGALMRLGTLRFRFPSAKRLEFSGDGRFLLAVGYPSGHFDVFAYPSGDPVWSLSEDEAGKRWGGLFAVALSRDGRTALTVWGDSGSGGSIIVFDMAADRLDRRKLRGRIDAAECSGNARAAAVADEEGGRILVSVAEPRLGAEARDTVIATPFPTGLTLSDDGSRVAAACGVRRTEIRVWNTATGAVECVFAGMPGFQPIAFAPDGRSLLIAAPVRTWDGVEFRDPAAHLLRLEGGTAKIVATAPEAGPLWSESVSGRSAVFSADGKRVLLRLRDRGTAWLWEPDRPGTQPEKVGEVPDGATLSPDGRELVSGGWERLSRFDLSTRRPVEGEAHFGPITGLAVSPDGRRLVSTSQGLAYGWDLATRRLMFRIEAAGTPVFAPDAKSFAIGRELRSAEDGKLIRPLCGVGGSATFLPPDKFGEMCPDAESVLGARWAAVLPDGRSVAVVTADRTDGGIKSRSWQLRFRRLSDGSQHLETTIARYYMDDPPALSPDGRLLAYHRRLIEVATGRTVADFGEKDDEWVTSIAFSGDNRRVAVGTIYGQVRVIDLADGRVLARYQGHRGKVSALAFAADGRVVSGGGDTTVLVWKPPPARERAARRLSAEEFENLWEILDFDEEPKDSDAPPPVKRPAESAWRGVQRLADAENAAALLAGKLKPAAATDPKAVEGLIARLLGDDAKDRRAAEKELLALDTAVIGPVRKRLEAGAWGAAAWSLGQVLDAVDTPVVKGEALRIVRAVHALELRGDAESLALLRTLAAGDASARLTREAAAAVGRLQPRPSAK